MAAGEGREDMDAMAESGEERRAADGQAGPGEGTPEPALEPESGVVETTPEPVPEPDYKVLAEERYDQLLRLRADFENYRRRVERDRLEVQGQVTGALVVELLPVYDNLERALRFMPDTPEARSWRVGVEMTLKGFDEVLARLGVTPIPSVGQRFDPAVHEAIQRVASEQPEGTVVEEVLKGFRWRDRVLRASQVKVSSGPAAPAEDDSAAGA
ncbi:Protein GrpE [Candidatus Hydrogenisulfobacillus filiaventi]|uniref:Protein GrpE n=1 Tax=Candidatus Hydrogenisulfobacillus filiaventi TaxID=2707344 RepID=A0A6F8ZIT1_9FIRM|nr:Protein GrpE [Candidatus Hydrogenisulfobacillus filiaventi]